jgi:hypothetical protein
MSFGIVGYLLLRHAEPALLSQSHGGNSTGGRRKNKVWLGECIRLVRKALCLKAEEEAQLVGTLTEDWDTAPIAKQHVHLQY